MPKKASIVNDGAAFDATIATCSWKQKSRGIARAVVVDGKSATQVATEFGVSPQYVRVIRNRYDELVRKLRLSEFMNREQPKLAPAIESFSDDMRTLRDRGYTVDQIVSYLEGEGLKATTSEVTRVLQKDQRA